MPTIVTQELAAFGATSLCLHGAIQLVQRRLWSDMGPLAVGVSLVGREWSTVTTVVMASMNVTKINDSNSMSIT